MAITQTDLPGVYQRPKCGYCGRTFKLPGAQGRYCNNDHLEAALVQQYEAEQEARAAGQAALLKSVTGDQVGTSLPKDERQVPSVLRT